MAEDTVVIKNLPSSLSNQDKSELLYYFGAIEVNIVGASDGKRNLAFAKFENNRAAELAVKKLHNLIILKHRISAEVSRKSNSSGILNENLTVPDCGDGLDKIEKAKSVFLEKLRYFINSNDFGKPPPLNIHYQFPPPTEFAINNICKAMVSVPKFYYQVLHLMNKMNMPCPLFDNYFEECDILQSTEQNYNKFDNNAQIQGTLETMSTSESEIGSDGEYTSQEIIPAKRKKVSKNTHVRPKFVKPQRLPNQSTKSSLRPDEVFEDMSKEKSSRKIELKITQNLSSIQEAQEVQHQNINRGFDKIIVSEKKGEATASSKDDDGEDKNYPVISKDQLAANQISEKDQRMLPAFKNYQAGLPSCRLYVKNLSKNVVSKDLHFIFRRYFRPELDQEQGSMFDIRLMQEGRMKGQAFITLQSKEQAQMALRETNGYILKDKPMVVQFARSANTSKK